MGKTKNWFMDMQEEGVQSEINRWMDEGINPIFGKRLSKKDNPFNRNITAYEEGKYENPNGYWIHRGQ